MPDKIQGLGAASLWQRFLRWLWGWIDRLLPSEAETRVAEARALEASDPPAAEAKKLRPAE